MADGGFTLHDAGPIRSSAFTEDGLARAFTERFADRLRYDHTAAKWFEWDGIAWRRDQTRRAFSWARIVCRDHADNAKDGERRTLSKVATASGVERFAQSDPAHAVTSAIWDADPMLLGTPGGTVELRTGELRRPVQEEHIAKLAAVTPAATPDCPRWLRFLDETTGSDADLIRFLRAWCGYGLTGLTREHALLFVYGDGGNGKGTFLNTVSRIMGGYHQVAAMETFTASSGDRHPTDLAMLAGARMVTAQETEEGRAWNESRLKALTGGDTITARFMRQDFFEFTPAFKLTIVGNHQPVLRNVDEAARRRFNIVPFTRKPVVKDPELDEKLRAEWPAILRWMIDGCLDWQANGLVRPQAVLDATAAYFTDQDSFSQWIEDCCDVTKNPPHLRDTNTSLFASWRNYASVRSEEAGTSKRFSAAMQRRGFMPIKDAPGVRGRGFQGIKVRVYEP